LIRPIKAQIDRILRETITNPVGPEIMAPPASSVAAHKSLHDRRHGRNTVTSHQEAIGFRCPLPHRQSVQNLPED
jgi:hypothetical protein